MGRNIVLCLDGTGNQLKATGNTNVVLLYQMLDVSNPDRQVAFYDPGVGTFGAKGTWTPVGQKLTKALGLARGRCATRSDNSTTTPGRNQRRGAGAG